MKHNFKPYLFMIVIAAIYIWAIEGTNTNPITFLQGLPNMADFVSRMLPPDFTDIWLYIGSALETLQIAIIGTTLAAIFALPISFLASRNIVSNKIMNHLVRLVLDAARGISEIVWALLFVAMVGLGPFPGVLALVVHETGALGKYFSESIENLNPSVIRAIKATGANKIQIIFHGIIPELKPLFTNYIFYYFEHSIRAATVLGLVGAGGIGFLLITRIKLFRYQELAAILLVILVIVVITDRASGYVRKRLVKDIK